MADPQAIEDVLAQWDVVACGPAEEIHAGRVYRVRTQSGQCLILKDLGAGRSMKRLTFEQEVLQHLFAAGVPVAVPLIDKRGRWAVPVEDHLFTLSPCLTAQSAAEAAPWDTLCTQYGAAIADLHVALASFPMEGVQGRTWRNVPAKEAAERIERLQRLLHGDEASRFQAIMNELAPGLQRALADLPEQLIHRDCHPANVLTEGGAVVGFVDCDHFSIGPRILDLAYFLIHLVKWDVADRGKTTAWLRAFPSILYGYQQKSPLSAGEKAALPYMMVCVLVMFADFLYGAGNRAAAKTELDTLAFVHSRFAEICERTLAT